MAALKLAKESGARVTKTSIMLGCGEQPHEVLHAFHALRDNGEIVQYASCCFAHTAVVSSVVCVQHASLTLQPVCNQ